MDFGGGDEIRFERRGVAGIVTMMRPKALNALTHRMVLALSRALEAWASDDAVEAVAICGEGRAFCAGGDILKVYEARLAGNPPTDFFADEYRLNAQIARFPKPYVALVDGIVMGGGVGISFHGSHRILTENAIFAMPEVGIGFFPDVGGSHLLPRLPEGFGLYLALSGNRIRHGDALWSTLATHSVASADQQAILDAICGGRLGEALQRFGRRPDPETAASERAVIAMAFSAESLEEVLDRLRDPSTGEFGRRTREIILSRSPTSVKVAYRQVRTGAALSMDDCMRMEYRILNRMLAGTDFYEGIRAAVIDKGDVPRWNPPALDGVSDAAVDGYFMPLPGGDLAL